MSEALVKKEEQAQAPVGLDQESIDLLRDTICKGASDTELKLFTSVCNRLELDPFAKQIYAIKRWDKQTKREIMQPMVSIDGQRLVAQRSGKYRGQIGPEWCGQDGTWRDTWLKKEHPSAARVGVMRSDFTGPLYGVAHWDEYAGTKKDGNLTKMWATKGRVMIAKCAESLALRKAFPQELSGVYTPEEMNEQAPTSPRLSGTGVDILDIVPVDSSFESGPDKMQNFDCFIDCEGESYETEGELHAAIISQMQKAQDMKRLMFTAKAGLALVSEDLKKKAREAFNAEKYRIEEREAIQAESKGE